MNLTEAKRRLRAEMKHGISALLPPKRESSAKDICLFSSRRGGSTWLMEALSAQGGLRYSDQPFCTWTLPPHLLRRLPKQLAIPFDSEDERLISGYFDGILSGRLNVNSRWDFWHFDFWKSPDRIVVKILAAKPIIDWFSEKFDVSIIYQVRHPISQSLSVIRAGWGNEVLADFLNVEGYVSANLTDEQFRYAHQIMENGTSLERQVLEWCLDNLRPFRFLASHPEWLLITYEQAILEPDKVVQALCRHLDLNDRSAIRNQLAAPSKTAIITNQKNRLNAVTGIDKVSQWRQTVSEDEEKRCMEIVEFFEIDFYQIGQDSSPARYLIP